MSKIGCLVILPGEFRYCVEGLEVCASLSVTGRNLLPQRVGSLEGVALYRTCLCRGRLGMATVGLLDLGLLSSMGAGGPDFDFSLVERKAIPYLRETGALGGHACRAKGHPLSPSGMVVGGELCVVLLALLSGGSRFLGVDFGSKVLVGKGNGVGGDLSIVGRLGNLYFFSVGARGCLVFLPYRGAGGAPSFARDR